LFEYVNTDYVLIKCGNFIDSKLLDLIEMKKEEISELKINPKKGRGGLSSIPIAVAISANARISISHFKNIPGNPLIYSDTDSAVLPLAISEEYIGKNIGQMSLVNTIKEGFFIGPKLYCYVNIKNDVVIASAGIDIIKVTERFIVRASEGRVDIDYNHKFTIKGIKKDSKIQKEIKDTPKWLKDNSLYVIGLNKKIKDRHPFSKVINAYMKNNIVNNKRSFSSTYLNKDNSKLSIIMDNSNIDLISSRYNGIYKVYDNI
jgi:hypothetical protein